MAKTLELEEFKKILSDQGLDNATISDIISAAQKKIAEKEDDKDDAPKPGKYRHLVLAYDPEGELAGKELTATVVKIPEENSVYSTMEGVFKAAYEYNTTKKGRRMPVKTVGEAFEHVAAKYFKEYGIKVLHKEPVYVLPIDGLIPTEQTTQHIDKRKRD